MAGLKSNLHLSAGWHEAILGGVARGKRKIALVNICIKVDPIVQTNYRLV